MCIQVVRSTGDYDFISPIINVTATAAVVTLSAVGVTTITSLACKALGIGGFAADIARIIPASIGALGLVVTVIGSGFCLAIAVYVFKWALSR